MSRALAESRAPVSARLRTAWTPFAAAAVRLGRGIAADLADFAFPQRCPGCGAPARAARFLCDPCLARVPRISFAVCARCLAAGRDPSSCRLHPGHEVWPAWVYDERAALLVHAFKYDGRTDLAPALGPALARVAPPAPRCDLVLAMPLHPARRRERGYNQAALLADALSGTLGAPHVHGVLERVRPTRPQARLDPAARRRNLDGAFRVARPEWIEGRSVLLVDDVITTGATFESALRVLGRAGARASGIALAWAQ